MYIGNTTTFKMKLGEAIDTSEIGILVTQVYCSADAVFFVPTTTEQVSDGTNLVDIAPGSNPRRVKAVAIINTDTITHVIFIYYGADILLKSTLAANEGLHYEDCHGWYVMQTDGSRKD